MHKTQYNITRKIKNTMKPNKSYDKSARNFQQLVIRQHEPLIKRKVFYRWNLCYKFFLLGSRNDSSGRPYVLLQFIFFHREISEVRGPIYAKFCHVVGSMFSLQMPVQKFGGLPQKNFGGEKR